MPNSHSTHACTAVVLYESIPITGSTLFVQTTHPYWHPHLHTPIQHTVNHRYYFSIIFKIGSAMKCVLSIDCCSVWSKRWKVVMKYTDNYQTQTHTHTHKHSISIDIHTYKLIHIDIKCNRHKFVKMEIELETNWKLRIWYIVCMNPMRSGYVKEL